MKSSVLTTVLLAAAFFATSATAAPRLEYRIPVPGLRTIPTVPEEPKEPEEPLELSLLEASLPQATKGNYYSYNFRQLLGMTGSDQPAFDAIAWSLGTEAAVPTGLTLSAAGVLSGVPEVKGTSDFEVVAIYEDASAQRVYRLVVHNAPLLALQVATGEHFSCAITTTYRVVCWGRNDMGQLGNGTKTNSLTPVYVSEIESGATQVTAGAKHACAIVNGAAKCWGSNKNGQLGNNSIIDSTTPVSVSGLASGVTSITASGWSTSSQSFTCAIQNNAAKCWGSNSSGRLGIGSATPSTSRVPVQVSGLTENVTSISAGAAHVCAVHDGAAKCWGANDIGGRLGNGGTTGKTSPSPVSGLQSGVVAISAGMDHSCAVTVGGGAKCWGTNSDGQLGNGTVTNALTPVNVSNLTGVEQIVAGIRYSCALAGGGMKCWGSNSSGRLGDGTVTTRLTPRDVPGLTSGVTNLALNAWADAGASVQTCAVLASNEVKCWGGNFYGQVGDGATSDHRLTPVLVRVP